MSEAAIDENQTKAIIPSENPYGTWLREEREKKGWKQQQLAEASGVSYVQIWNLENGKSLNPREATKLKLSKALGVELPQAVQEKSEKEAQVLNLGALIDFDPHDPNDRPEVHGIYVFYDITDRPVYVGGAWKQTISARVKQHYEKFWFKQPIVNHAAYIEINDEKLCRQVETILIRFLKSNAVLNLKNVDRE